MVDSDDAIWHVTMDGDQHGPLSRAQVLAYLHDGQVVGSGLIWRPGFADWKPVSEVAEFWQPPPSPRPSELPEWVEIDTASTFQVSPSGKQWSIWKAANVGLIVSVLTMALQIANGRGVELAAYVQAASVNTITHLAGRILAMPVIFVMIAMIVNAFKGQSPSSGTSATKGAITFVLMLVGVVLSLVLYAQWFFSSDERISGGARDWAIKQMQPICMQRQKSISSTTSDEQESRYCRCFSEKMADRTTYRKLTDDPTAPEVLPNLKKQAEAAGQACQIR
jgi:uncharacterized membrane protein YtjA (UPF0391 family)